MQLQQVAVRLILAIISLLPWIDASVTHSTVTFWGVSKQSIRQEALPVLLALTARGGSSIDDANEENEEESMSRLARELQDESISRSEEEVQDEDDSLLNELVSAMDDPSEDDDHEGSLDETATKIFKDSSTKLEEEAADPVAELASSATTSASSSGETDPKVAIPATARTAKTPCTTGKTISFDPNGIDEATTQKLVRQGFSPDEVSRLKPSVAAIIAANGLDRPSEGLLDHWLASKTVPSLNKVRQKKKIAVVSTIATVLALASVAIWRQDPDWLFDLKEAAIEGWYSIIDFIPVGSGNAQEKVEGAYAQDLQADELTEKDEKPVVPSLESVKPIPTTRTSSTNELDVTWLDKAITGSQNALGRLLRIKRS